MRSALPLGVVLFLSLMARTAAAEPLAREDVPEPLRPWVDWVLRGHERETCPFFHESGERACVWPGRLALSLSQSGGDFEQAVFVSAESEVPLPGGGGDGGGAWPEDVRVDDAPAAVAAGEDGPALRLARGVHRLSGHFRWRGLPPVLLVPPQTGLVALEIDGAPVPFPRRDQDGRLWLRDGGAGAAPARPESRVEVDVHRRLHDAVPILLETVITLRVSGEAREETLGIALPAKFVPLRLTGGVPARLDPDGRLRVQLRPGEWQLSLDARLDGRAEAFGPPQQPKGAKGWDPVEIWTVALAPELRLVDVEGAPMVDPSQTEMPGEWRHLPAYRMEPGAALRLVEKRRGVEGGVADQLSLARIWHLDFDGGGATVADEITGTLRESMRLEMAASTALGRAAVNGVDQPITKRPGREGFGLEVPLGPLQASADSRVEGGVSRLPAVGWDHDFDSVRGRLELPPGYLLLHATGVDAASPTWISRWDLLDVFVVMIVAAALFQLAGPRVGVLALAALALSFTEPGAPRLVWLALAVTEALRRVAPSTGRIARIVAALQAAALLTLIAIGVPFALAQVRGGLFPALERPGAEVRSGAFAYYAPEAPAAQPGRLQEAGAALGAEEIVVTARKREAFLDQLSSEAAAGFGPKQKTYAPDPNASVPTGPGRPDWTWQSIDLTWSGPVTRDQQLGLWLIPPLATSALALLRVALVAALALVLLRMWRRHSAPAAGSSAAATVALALLAFTPLPARADFPSPELLETLRARLLEPAACQPSCAAIPHATLSISPARLEVRLALDATAETALPLPGGAGDATWTPSVVELDGAPASALQRDDEGVLWLRVARGRHTALLSGALPARASVALPLPLAPRRVELAGPTTGWTVVGIHPDGSAGDALQLVRVAQRGGAPSREGVLEPSEIPPFVEVVRLLDLGLSWGVETRVRRVAPAEGAILIELPLLAGESVTTPGVRVQNGRALITLGATEEEVALESTLPIAERIALAAPERVPWTEEWNVAVGPLWHLESDGVPPVDRDSGGLRFRSWRPLPGEKLALAIERPAGEAAATLTIDRSQLALRPGLRATDATLTLALRSSQGGQHALTLPEGAQLTELRVNGQPQPLRQEERRVPLALAPGSREIVLGWREPHELGSLLRASAVDLDLPSVNAHVEIDVPEKRWVLLVGGPRLGPSVLFWPTLAVVAGLAVLLGRIRWTPLRTRHWLLLGVGLTQAPLPASGLVVVWLLVLGWRGRWAERLASAPRIAFRSLQIALVLLTLAAAVALAIAIEQGLLGTPEMRIAGNGSDAGTLRWYLDRSAPALPQPWALALSTGWYRAAMLSWALWLALAGVGWVRWGFAQWTAGGAWGGRRAEAPPAP